MTAAGFAAWKKRAIQQTQYGVSDLRPAPLWVRNVPACSQDACPLYDGKRCKFLGHQPSSVCEPVVQTMGNLLNARTIR